MDIKYRIERSVKLHQKLLLLNLTTYQEAEMQCGKKQFRSPEASAAKLEKSDCGVSIRFYLSVISNKKTMLYSHI